MVGSYIGSSDANDKGKKKNNISKPSAAWPAPARNCETMNDDDLHLIINISYVYPFYTAIVKMFP